jgi:hypothetical protein
VRKGREPKVEKRKPKSGRAEAAEMAAQGAGRDAGGTRAGGADRVVARPTRTGKLKMAA